MDLLIVVIEVGEGKERVVTGLMEEFEIFLEVEGQGILAILDINNGDEICGYIRLIIEQVLTYDAYLTFSTPTIE